MSRVVSPRRAIADRTARIRKKRPSLRIIISSATIDAQAFADFFNEDLAQPTKALADEAGAPPQKEAAIISLEGRAFPVQIAYAEKPVDDYLVAAIDAVWKVHLNVGSCEALHAPPRSYIPPRARRSRKETSWSSSPGETRSMRACRPSRTGK